MPLSKRWLYYLLLAFTFQSSKSPLAPHYYRTITALLPDNNRTIRYYYSSQREESEKNKHISHQNKIGRVKN